MRKLYGICLALTLLLWADPLRAQWSGSVDLSGGLGGMEGSIVNDEKPMIHGLAQGTLKLNYTTEKFTCNTTVTEKWEPKTTDNSRLAYKKENLGLVYKAASTKPLTTSIKTDLIWTPSKERKYSSWILYQYKNDRASNHTLNVNGNAEEVEKVSYYYEVPKMDEHKVETGLRTFNSFNSGRNVLHSSILFQAVTSKKANTWSVFKTEEGQGSTSVVVEDVNAYAWRYRITPSSTDFKLEGDIRLQNTLSDDDLRLTATPGLRFVAKNTQDRNSGATLVGYDPENENAGEWRDSLRLREYFNYLSVQAEHYVQAHLGWRNFDVNADYALQVFSRRLNDDDHRQKLAIKGIYPVGKANVRWIISPLHSLNLISQMSVSHPDYLKVCWYDRTAGYMDQLYRGNEQLLSPQTMLYTLEYEFKWKRFGSQTSVTYKDIINEIDQTWFNEEIDGRQYKIFRWLNSSDSRTVGLSQKLSWNGKVITAHAAITYNQSTRTSKTDRDKIKNTFDWKLTGDISARLGKGWSVGFDAKYQSKVATFFTIFKEYCELNALIQKDFKRITVYLQGKDLLDMPRETSFESAELQEFWVEEVRSNRRFFIIGARWKF